MDPGDANDCKKRRKTLDDVDDYVQSFKYSTLQCHFFL